MAPPATAVKKLEAVGIDKLCEDFGRLGGSIRKLAKEHGVAIGSVHNFFSRPENIEKFREAKSRRADEIVEEIFEIADDPNLGVYKDITGAERVDTGAVNRAKLRIENRRWLAGVLDPERFAPKDGASVQINLNQIHLQLLRKGGEAGGELIEGQVTTKRIANG